MHFEIRRVPPDWQHPTDATGKYEPASAVYYGDAVLNWITGHLLLESGMHPAQIEYGNGAKKEEMIFFAEMEGPCPDVRDYNREKWTSIQATHFQVYEISSKGTPVLPVMSFDQFKEYVLREGWPIQNYEQITAKPDLMIYKVYPNKALIVFNRALKQTGHKI